MTIRRIIPFILTVLFFIIIYWLTMIIPNKTLFFGYGLDETEVINNNKIPLHSYVFIYGLTLVILVVNLLEIFSTLQDKFWQRFLKSILTVFLIYFLTHYIFKLLNTKVWNMHYNPRGIPANIWFFETLFLISIGLIVLEAFKKLVLLKFDKSDILEIIPKWIRL